eukprot:gene11406-7911_t
MEHDLSAGAQDVAPPAPLDAFPGLFSMKSRRGRRGVLRLGKRRNILCTHG